MDDLSLIQRAKKGDRSAFAALFKRHYSYLVKYLVTMTFDVHLSEDLAQESMFKCMQKIHTFDENYRFQTWLTRIATNTYIDYLRVRKRESRYTDESDTGRQLAWRTAQMGEEWTDMMQALTKIPSDIRMPIVLKHYHGYSYEDIAERMRIPIGTVKSRIHQGLKRLRQELMEHEIE